MITLCPQCGHELPRPLLNGLTSCVNCRRVFDSSRSNRLLSAAWLVRRQHIVDANCLVVRHGYSEEDAKFVIEFVADGCYSHDEFLVLLKEMGIVGGRKAS